VSRINTLEKAEATIASLQPREDSFRSKYEIEPSVDSVGLRDRCRQKVDQNEEEQSLLNELMELHLARRAKNSILIHFANRFRILPHISQGETSNTRSLEVWLIQDFL
jgi:hypothetical protein